MFKIEFKQSLLSATIFCFETKTSNNHTKIYSVLSIETSLQNQPLDCLDHDSSMSKLLQTTIFHLLYLGSD